MAHYPGHDHALIHILDTIGSNFVSIFYNQIYFHAKRMRMGKSDEGSLTDTYREVMTTYILAVQRDSQHYRASIENLHKYFLTEARYCGLIFPAFVDKIVERFVPAEYFKDLNNAEKDDMLGHIISQLLGNLGCYIAEAGMLSRIIDHTQRERDSLVTLKMLQDFCVQKLLAIRDDSHNRFLRMKTQTVEEPAAGAQQYIINTLKSKLKEMVHELAGLRAYRTEASQNLREMEHELAELRTYRTAGPKQVEELQLDIKRLEAERDALLAKIKMVSGPPDDVTDSAASNEENESYGFIFPKNKTQLLS